MSETPQKFLPYGRQCIEDDDIQAVTEALKRDFLTTGPTVKEFEDALSAATKAPHAIAVSNGTTALHLACLAVGLGPGDVAIVPTITFLATANAVRYCNADVVFADVDPATGQLTAETLLEALDRAKGKNVKAVLPVHLGGRCVDMQAIRAVCDKHNLKIIADSCHAIGSEYPDNGVMRPVGSCALEDIAIFSFHPVKTIAMGEGGAITTANAEMAARIRTMRTHGMTQRPDLGPWYYDMQDIGFNYREPDILCALGISQLRKLDRFVKRRTELVEFYNRQFNGTEGIQTPASQAPAKIGWHLYAISIDFDHYRTTRAQVMDALKARGIGSQVHYIPVHSQPYYQKLYGDADLPGAWHYYQRTLSLPLYPTLTNEDAAYVADNLLHILKQNRKVA